MNASARLLFLALCAALALAQRNTGELRVVVRDPLGNPLKASAELQNRAAQYKETFPTSLDGRATAKSLPFGIYLLRARAVGFAPHEEAVEVRSEIPREIAVTLGIAPIETTVTVRETQPLIDPYSTGTPSYIGSQTVREHAHSQPGRALLEMIDAQPGWLLEANGVLHPRGSEYQTQYVLDGLPLTDNRSPAFAPSIEPDDVESMTVLTSGYPAEYGRKLGGVVEVRSPDASAPGPHGAANLGGGSFNTEMASASIQYGAFGKAGRNSAGLALEGSRTDRYLDPPVLENFTNHADLGGARSHFEHTFSDSDRLRLAANWNRGGFQVPNERIQELSGQRQDRGASETMGQVSWQHIFSPSLLLNVRGMMRDLSADLYSNSLATPIVPDQGRGFRDGYANAGLSGHSAIGYGTHEWKIGGDAVFSNLHERFAYRITDPNQFDPDTPAGFSFNGKGIDREQSAYAQDLWRLGRLTLSAGLRFDHYRLLVKDSAWSPRLGVAYTFPKLGLVLRGSYDRVFQTPANEGLLVSGSLAIQGLNDHVLSLPVRPSHGNYYQIGFAQSLFAHLRLDADWYLRDFDNFADDDLLLNTGVSFPISFAHARVRGFETRVEVPRWGRFSGSAAYSNMIGVGRLPITGGLFFMDNAAAQLTSTDRFAITQDQRNTVHGRVRAQVAQRVWTAVSASYNSGLPVEIDNPDLDFLRAQYGTRILDRVNFDRGRVRPSFSLDASLGADVWKRDRYSVRLQVDAFNLTNRLNLINFAGLFSGTAVARPRGYGAGMRFEF
ncbi:MAG: TonB-dependent receptor [Acidobacteriota bacterium]|nr:TonB-dependent receptor [Acidobacteriota bacterium]